MGNDKWLFSWCKANKKCQKTVLCKKCTYVQKYINGKDEKIDPPEDIEQTFFSSYFSEKPNFTV